MTTYSASHNGPDVLNGSITTCLRTAKQFAYMIVCMPSAVMAGATLDTFPEVNNLHAAWRRTLGWHQAEELLLRAVVAPAAERWVALGVDEPPYPGRVAEGGARRRPWWQLDLEECVGIASVMVSKSLQVGFCMCRAAARTPRKCGQIHM